MRTVALLGMLLILGSVTPGAQGSVTALSGPPRIAFEHDGVDILGFALYARPSDGVELAFDLGPVPRDETGLFTARLPALPPGTYRLEVAAYNAKGEGPRMPLPGNTIQVTADGRWLVPAEAKSPVDPPASKMKTPQPAARKGGVFGKLWRGVIGD